MTKFVSIKAVAEINPRNEGFADDGRMLVSFLPMAAISESGFISYQEERPYEEVSKGYTSFRDGDVLLAKITPCMENGKAALVSGLNHDIGFGSTEFHVIRPSDAIDARYLFYIIWSSRFRKNAENNMTGSAGQKRVPVRFVEDFVIPLPPLDTQKKIADILDKAQELIDKRQRQIELLDEFLESLFLDMFGDPVRNPKGWITRRIEELADVITGNTPPRKDVENYGDYIEWIKSDNINTPSHYITAAVEHLSERGLEKGRSVDSGAILMTCIAGSINCIGNVALVDRKVAFNQQINALVPKDVNLYFLYSLLLASKSYIQAASTNSMKGMVSKGNLEKLEFISPPAEKQLEFQGLFLEYLHQRKLFETSIAEMQNLFNSIMQRAFKGELFN